MYIRPHDYDIILLKDHTILIKLRERIDGERVNHRQPFIIYKSLLVFTDWKHEGEPGDVEPEVYMHWITLFQSTLGFFTPTSAEDLFENLGKLVALPGRKLVTIENNEAKRLY